MEIINHPTHPFCQGWTQGEILTLGTNVLRSIELKLKEYFTFKFVSLYTYM